MKERFKSLVKFRNLLILLFLIGIPLLPLFAQDELDGYTHLVTLEQPVELKDRLPSDIIMDSTAGIFIISYDYKPSTLDFYDINTWSLKKRVEIKGHVYLFRSFFKSEENAVYIANGSGLKKYICIDLETFETKQVKLKYEPIEDEYDANEFLPITLKMIKQPGNNSWTLQSIIRNGWNIIVVDDNSNYVRIYLKDVVKH